jgi:hypothetical protein
LFEIKTILSDVNNFMRIAKIKQANKNHLK